MSLTPHQLPATCRPVIRRLTTSVDSDSRQHVIATRIRKNLKDASLLHRSVDGRSGKRTLALDELAADVILGEAITADRGEFANFVLEDIHGDGERIGSWGGEGGGEEGDEGEQL